MIEPNKQESNGHTRENERFKRQSSEVAKLVTLIWGEGGGEGEKQNLKREKGYNFNKPKYVIQHYQLQQCTPSLPGFHKSVLKLEKTKCFIWLAFIRSLCHTSQFTCAAITINLPRDNIYRSSTSRLKMK